MKLSHVAAAAALSFACAHSNAVVVNFGELIAGAGAPASLSFAQLTYDVVGANVLFTLNAAGLDLFSGTDPFIGSMAVDGNDVGSVSDVLGGVTSVGMSSANGPGGGFEFRFNFGQGNNNRLTDNESVSWTWLGGAGNFSDFALHVQGISYGQTTSAWYGGTAVTAPIPEPETYALMLAGLGVVGFVARRRKARA